MKRNYEDYDADLLLSWHNELGRWERLRLAWHLRGCETCRQKQEMWTHTSRHIAGAMRASDAPQWSPPNYVRGISLVPLLIVTLLIMLVLGGTVLRYSSAKVTLDKKYSPSSQLSPSQGGCTPNLPSDRCR